MRNPPNWSLPRCGIGAPAIRKPDGSRSSAIALATGKSGWQAPTVPGRFRPRILTIVGSGISSGRPTARGSPLTAGSESIPAYSWWIAIFKRSAANSRSGWLPAPRLFTRIGRPMDDFFTSARIAPAAGKSGRNPSLVEMRCKSRHPEPWSPRNPPMAGICTSWGNQGPAFGEFQWRLRTDHPLLRRKLLRERHAVFRLRAHGLWRETKFSFLAIFRKNNRPSSTLTTQSLKRRGWSLHCPLSSLTDTTPVFRFPPMGDGFCTPNWIGQAVTWWSPVQGADPWGRSSFFEICQPWARMRRQPSVRVLSRFISFVF